MGRTLSLTTGNDSFTQGLSAQNVAIVLSTLAGNDTVILNRVDNLGGSNRILTGIGNDVVDNRKEFANNIYLGDGNDSYVGQGFGSFATDIGDRVFGGLGNDFFAVSTFKSQYAGQEGNDRFLSVGWQNNFNGGVGVDSISYAIRDEDLTQGGTGVTINLAQGFAQTGANRRETLTSIEYAIGSGADDVIIGSAARNRLEGGAGIDELTGGAGGDHFVFAKASDSPVFSDAVDLITDFHRAEGDKINLATMDSNALLAQNQAFSYISAAAFNGIAGQVRAIQVADGMIVTGDVNGDRVADFQIGVLGVTSLLVGDFVL